MKVALLTDGIYPYVMGGMQKHSYFLAKHLAQQNVEVDLYHYKPQTSIKQEDPFSQEELKNLNLIEIEYPASKKFPGHYLYERYLYSINVWEVFKKRELPDFIYIKGFSGWELLKNKKRLGHIPVGVNFHGYEMFQQWPDFKTGLKLQLLKLPVKYQIKNADFLFSYGGKITEILECLTTKSKIIKIPTGIGASWLNEETPFTAEKKRKFIFVGRSERRKGIIELNAVLAANSLMNMEFHFVGPIPESDQIKKENIVYHGAIHDQEELKEVLDQMDVLVCPSHSEGMPNVIMEGMARGLAIIATNVGAVNQMVDSRNGWLIEKSNIKAGINTAILEALQLSYLELNKKKKFSIDKVKQNFTWETVIEQTLKELKVRSKV